MGYPSPRPALRAIIGRFGWSMGLSRRAWGVRVVPELFGSSLGRPWGVGVFLRPFVSALGCCGHPWAIRVVVEPGACSFGLLCHPSRLRRSCCSVAGRVVVQPETARL